MRTVYPGREIPHRWIHQSQSNARSSNGTIFFDGPSIFSYGRHFEMARIVTNDSGARMVLLNESRYSVTTSKHQSYVRRAIPDWMPAIEVPDPGMAPDDNLRALVDKVGEKLLKAFRARKYRPYILEEAVTLAEHARKLAHFYKLPEPVIPQMTEEGAAAIKAQIAALKLEQEAQRRAAHERHMVEMRADLERWKTGEIIARSGFYNLGADFLRINGEEVETTKGARVPIEHVRAVWPIIARLYASGATYKRNGHTIHLGHYALDEITPDGTVIAGCHRFERAEVERFAAVLGLEVPNAN